MHFFLIFRYSNHPVNAPVLHDSAYHFACFTEHGHDISRSVYQKEDRPEVGF